MSADICQQRLGAFLAQMQAVRIKIFSDAVTGAVLQHLARIEEFQPKLFCQFHERFVELVDCLH